VILISLDSCRADHLSSYGYRRPTTPNLDAVAARGALFLNAYSSTSWTLPAHMALFTALPDSVHGVNDNGRPALDPARVTLAQQFKAASYETAAFVSGPYLHASFGFDRGFDRYVNCTSYPEAKPQRGPRPPEFDPAVHDRSHLDVTNPRLFQAVEAWLGTPHDRPFFLFVHVWDIHYDYVPPPPFDKRFDPDYHGLITATDYEKSPAIHKGMDPRDLAHIVALYDGEIASTDDYLGRLFKRIDDLGLAGHTLVVVTADHGDEFFEHGNKGHQKSLYDEVLRIPLIMRWPGHVPEGVRVKEQARIIDIAPTIRALCALPPNPEGVGVSLVDHLHGRGKDLPAYAELEVASAPLRLRSVRLPAFKLIRDLLSDRQMLYDPLADPGETALLPSNAPLAAQASRYLGDWSHYVQSLTRSLPHTGGRGAAQLPQEVVEKLKSIGYVDSHTGGAGQALPAPPEPPDAGHPPAARPGATPSAASP
jgi:arylsulfatase A-like enzyme